MSVGALTGEARSPTADALASALLAACDGDYGVAIRLVRRTLDVLLKAQVPRLKREHGPEDDRRGACAVNGQIHSLELAPDHVRHRAVSWDACRLTIVARCKLRQRESDLASTSWTDELPEAEAAAAQPDHHYRHDSAAKVPRRDFG